MKKAVVSAALALGVLGIGAEAAHADEVLQEQNVAVEETVPVVGTTVGAGVEAKTSSEAGYWWLLYDRVYISTNGSEYSPTSGWLLGINCNVGVEPYQTVNGTACATLDTLAGLT